MAAALLACGIDPERSTLFAHSAVPAHPELAWLLNCVARIGWLNRMTQFKEKSGKNREGASIGLFDYPVLQAADVLLYRASHVPVGEDQKQHVELMRDIALKFNTDYDTELLVPPEPLIGQTAARVMSLRDGNTKMSKSDPSDMSRINLTDDADTIAQKIRKAKTDPEPLPDEMDALNGRPEAKNLVTVYAELADEEPSAVLTRFAGQGFGQFKPALTELLAETLRPIKARLDDFRDDPGELDRLLAAGADQARTKAQPTLDGAYRAMGLRRWNGRDG
jgi:tryptophanyl-tRNA synthetase